MGAFRRTLAAFRKQQEESRQAQDPDGASQSRSREAVGQEDGAGSEEEIEKEGRRRAKSWKPLPITSRGSTWVPWSWTLPSPPTG